jgi:phage/plasmid-like protein (TIGR03299 family)
MSHMIEMRKLDSGEMGSFVASRTAGWHLLGHVADEDLSIDRAVKILNPGQIVKMPIYSDFILPTGPTAIAMAGKMGTYRVRGDEVISLGVVSESYSIFQDTAVFQFLGQIIASHGAVVSATGLLNDGKRSFMCLELPNTVKVGGGDEVRLFIFCYTGHDGTLQLSIACTPIRVQCHNTVTLALQGAQRKYQVKHTSQAVMDADTARATLDIIEGYPGAFAAYAERMISTPVSTDAFERMMRQMWGKEADRPGASKKAMTKFSNLLNKSMDLWTGQADNTLAGIQGTAWAAYNLGEELIQWGRSVRMPDQDQNGAAAQQRRLENALQDKDAAEIAKWQNVVMAMA